LELNSVLKTLNRPDLAIKTKEI